MKNLALFSLLLAAALPSFADSTNSLEKFSPHFTTNTPIIWRAPTNNLPQSLYVYQRLPTRPFSTSIISNAMVLASLSDRQFPGPSTNDFYVWSPPNACGSGFSVFSLKPAFASIAFSSTNQNLSTEDLPQAETITNRAFEYASRFGLDAAQLLPKNVYSSSNASGFDKTSTNGFCGRGIYLARQLDGISFFGDADSQAQGFSVEFGSHGEIRAFSSVWANLKRDKKIPALTPAEIIQRIREHQVLMLPDNQSDYLVSIENLTRARTFTIVQMTPYYGEGVLGEEPLDNSPSRFIVPFAELAAVADFGKSNAIVHLLCPIISPELSKPFGDRTN